MKTTSPNLLNHLENRVKVSSGCLKYTRNLSETSMQPLSKYLIVNFLRITTKLRLHCH